MKFNVPNIRAMWVETLGLNKLLIKWGIQKKERNIYFLPNKNRRINRYLDYQWKRLRKASTNRNKFSKISLLLLLRSKSFRILALTNVRPNWYKDLKWSVVQRTMHQLNGICHRGRDYYRFCRVPIPKPDGGVRFLTVPPLEMRLYLWIVNILINLKSEKLLNQHQYGHRKGKGLVEAWKELASGMKEYKNIYEFDFKKFHDTINRDTLSRALYNTLKVNTRFCEKVVNLQGPWTRGPLHPDDPNIRCQETDLLGEMFGITATPRLNRYNILCGVPQGANTSALLGIVVLEYLNIYDLKDSKYIGYADDGVILTNREDVNEELEEKLDTVHSGIRLKPERSGWVKIGEEWKKTLKFLGCEWTSDGFYSATHSGKRKKWTWGDLETNVEQLKSEWKALEDAKPSGWKNKMFTIDPKDPYKIRPLAEKDSKELLYLAGEMENTDLPEKVKIRMSLELGRENKYAGLLFAKLFEGESDKKADRELKSLPGSWLDKTNKFCKIENASSYAIIGLSSEWKKEWSYKQPLKYKKRIVHVDHVDDPGIIEHPLLSGRGLAQLTDFNLFQPHYAQPSPIYPKKWTPKMYTTVLTRKDQAQAAENYMTINPGIREKSLLLFGKDILEKMFKKSNTK
jgi:hypothetical protein